MEELDDLKSIWKQQPDFEKKNETEILSMLQGKSKSLIAKLKRSVWFELILTIFCILALGAYSITLPPGALMWTILCLLILLVSYSAYYIKKILLLNEYNPAVENLSDNLTHLIKRLDAYIKFYKRSYAILYPVFFALGLLFGAIESGLDRFTEKFSSPVYAITFVVISIVFMIGIYKITDWYLNKLYGNHIEKLKSLLAELQG